MPISVSLGVNLCMQGWYGRVRVARGSCFSADMVMFPANGNICKACKFSFLSMLAKTVLFRIVGAMGIKAASTVV